MNKLLDRYNKLNLTIKCMLWFTICNVLLKGISLISVPIFTRLLNADEYGKMTVFMSYESIFLILSTWDISPGAYQKGIFKYKACIKSFTTATQLFTNIVTLSLFLFVFIFRGWLVKFTKVPIRIWILWLLYFLLIPGYNNWLIYQRAQLNYKKPVLVTLFYSLLNISVPLAGVLLIGRTAEIKYGVFLIVSCVIFLFMYVPNAEYRNLKGKWNDVKEQWLFIIKFQLPCIAHSLSLILLNFSDRVMIGKMVGNTQAGYYSIAYNLASVASLLQNSFNQVLYVWRYKKLENKEYSIIYKSTDVILALVSSGILAFIMIAPEAMKVLFTDDYYEAVWCIPPVSAGVFFIFLYSTFANIESYFERTKYIMYVSVSCSILNIVLNYCLIGIYGYIVCAYTTLISYMIFAVGHYCFMKRVCRSELPGVELFNLKFIFLISFAVLSISIGVTFLFPYPYIRYGLVFLIIFTVYFNQKKIMGLAAQLKE